MGVMSLEAVSVVEIRLSSRIPPWVPDTGVHLRISSTSRY
ncbi:MAG: hypothetical protein MjAS7_1923 [Metallosphaera javensis (ex Sakai et al. 2022)]|nr:MAG: hypothetical protein MjAS7_1923 [Metallosphaera javensis (ex Sakai et al. 2022)]